MRERVGGEREAWVRQVESAHEAGLQQKERELKERLRRDRNKEIELAIHRLEEDNQTARDECERVAENKIK